MIDSTKQQITQVNSEGVVDGGRIIGEYDFYNYVKMFEGKTIKWSIALLNK